MKFEQLAGFIGYIAHVDLVQANSVLRNIVSGNQPFQISRMGSVEANAVSWWQQHHNFRNFRFRERKDSWIYAGIYPPTNSILSHFSEKYIGALATSDAIAVWPSGLQKSHDKVLDSLSTDIKQFPMSVLDIFACAQSIELSETWIQALANMRVLVIHPFAKSMTSQYQKLDKLHGRPILPRFNLSTFAPPETQGLDLGTKSFTKCLNESYKALDILIEHNRPDIALIAAGAYGVPIGSFLKTRNVSSIYVGGALQLYFGIMGRRWVNREDLKPFITSNWLDRPYEKPPFGSRLIEGGSYW